MFVIRLSSLLKASIRTCLRKIGTLLGYYKIDDIKKEVELFHIESAKNIAQLERQIRNLLQEVKRLNASSFNRSSQILGRNEKCRVLFIIHAPQFWIALKPIYLKLKENPFFEPIIFSIPGRLLDSQEFTNSSKDLFTGMEGKIVVHDSVGPNLISTIHSIHPHVIFKQTPWEGQYPSEVRTEMLNNYRICYVPYGIHTTANQVNFYGDELHTKAWRIYCANHADLASCRGLNPTSDINAIVSGYPKFEQIIEEMDSLRLHEWPIRSAESTSLKILWAPHHSTESWLGFCTFHKIFRQMLNYAKDNVQVQIVLRPHPAMFETLLNQKIVSEDDIKNFIDEFTSLPNAYIDSGNDYMHLFKHSDLLVTDGVGFLFEYLLTGKPIVHTDSRTSVGFAPYYDRMQKAFYKAYDFNEVERTISNLREKIDPLSSIRKEVLLFLHPIDQIGSPSRFIMEDIQKSFARGEI